MGISILLIVRCGSISVYDGNTIVIARPIDHHIVVETFQASLRGRLCQCDINFKCTVPNRNFI